MASTALAGCSSSGGKGSGSSTGLTSSSSAPGTTTATTPATSSSSPDITADDIRPALLTATDIAATATAKPSTPTDNPLPCAAKGSPSLEQQVPSEARAGVDISDNSQQAALSEEIRVYTDAATASHAVALAQAGLHCASGSLVADDGTAITITLKAPVDIKSDILKDANLAQAPINSAQVWQASGEGLDILLVLVQLDQSLLLMSFISPTGSNQSTLPDPITIVQKAIEKGGKS